jgi:hypothetical protein
VAASYRLEVNTHGVGRLASLASVNVGNPATKSFGADDVRTQSLSR